MLDTAEVIDIWSCPPKSPNLVGEMEAEGGYLTARETGLSVITEEQDNGSFGQVRYYFRIIQITANMLSGGKLHAQRVDAILAHRQVNQSQV